MNRNKIYTTIIAALSATIMFTGCGATTETKVPLEVVGTVPSVTITTLETIPTTETTREPYKTGELVWCLLHADEEFRAQVATYKVIEERDGYVVVTYPEDQNGEPVTDEVLKELLNGITDDYIVHTYPIEDCYRNRDEAFGISRIENEERGYDG